jgi:hypothetical protein
LHIDLNALQPDETEIGRTLVSVSASPSLLLGNRVGPHSASPSLVLGNRVGPLPPRSPASLESVETLDVATSLDTTPTSRPRTGAHARGEAQHDEPDSAVPL